VKRAAVARLLAEVATLTAELRSFEVRLTQAANAVYNAREGQHDDLVLATALPLWGARALRPNYLHVSSYLGQGDIRPYGQHVPPYGRRR